MPIKRSAYKELRKARVRHFKNITTKSELKTLSKKFEKLLSSKKTEDANSLIRKIVSQINKAASKGIIHKNTASRKISRLMKKAFHSSAKA